MFTVYVYDYEMHEEMILTHGDARHCYYYARSSARQYASLGNAPFEISVVNDETAEIVTRFKVLEYQDEELPFYWYDWHEIKGRS